jgi:protein gp37
MSIKTKIEYCDSTVNPVMGCTGCALRKEHCYAASMCTHYAGSKGWPKSFDNPELFPGRLETAINWKDLTHTPRPHKPWLNGQPRHIFINDMSDGFCPDVNPEQWLTPHLPAMAESPHVWLFLTKWPHIMARFFRDQEVPPNFWLGTSSLQQKDEWRIAHLLQINSPGVKWVSLEPLLEAIDLDAYLAQLVQLSDYDSDYRDRLFWVTCGGESGSNARPMHPNWARLPRNQCQATRVPFFFKQWGAYVDIDNMPQHTIDTVLPLPVWRWATMPDDTQMYRVGKKAAGRLLDGRQWNEMPCTRQ